MSCYVRISAAMDTKQRMLKWQDGVSGTVVSEQV